MKIQLKDLEIGNEVWCGGDSGFCHAGVERVERVEFKFDENSGEKYKVIILNGNRKFDSRYGGAITPPKAYYLMATEQQINHVR